MTYDDVQSKIYALTGTNTTSLPVATLNTYTQPAEDRVASLILQADGRWQWEDTNNTDLPIATTTITASQQDYSIAVTHLKLLRAEIKLSGATYFTKLDPVDQEDEDIALDNVTTGPPYCYDMVGNSVFLYPIPNYTQASSLKLYYQRGPLKFDYSTDKFTDGTGSSAASSPGFNSLYHSLICYLASYDYAVAKGVKTANGFLAKVQQLEAQIVKDYGKRDKDDRQIMTMKRVNYI